MNFAYRIVCLSFCFYVVNATNLFDFFRTKRQTKCNSRQFKCNNGQCISEFDICDGARNCDDGSDETQAICSKFGPECQSHTFRCAYGACVDANSKCNGVRDCADNSDELLIECQGTDPNTSSCRDDEFMCKSGQCINQFSVCDGTSDCKDGSDETIAQCITINCGYSFQCAYGACIDKTKKCDGVFDCSDRSDESEELCDRLVTPKPTTSRPPPPRPRPTPSPTGMCVLPEKPYNGNYKVECLTNEQSPKCRGVIGTPVEAPTILTYTCNEGYVLKDKKQHLVCLHGKWNADPPICLQLCKGLHADTLDLICSYRGDIVPCDVPQIPGTKVQPTCKQAYKRRDGSSALLGAECGPNGRWNRILDTCSPVCGKAYEPVSEPLVSFGYDTKVGEFPWHAGIYLTKDYEYLCGGTIITQYIILTAAHCFYDTRNGRFGRKANEIKVSVGKYKRQFNQRENDQQDFDVREIIPQIAYRGETTGHEQDIAVLELVISIEFNTVVSPVCIDWDNKIILTNGVKGTVVGWGLDENQQSSEVLKVAQLPYMDQDNCQRISSPQFIKFIRYDKICAGYTNGTGVAPGDSGGGLTFIKDDLHWIRGIVSNREKGNTKTIALFTDVNEHMMWLKDAIKAIETNHTNH